MVVAVVVDGRSDELARSRADGPTNNYAWTDLKNVFYLPRVGLLTVNGELASFVAILSLFHLDKIPRFNFIPRSVYL